MDAMVKMLKRHGLMFTGNDPEGEAQDWLDHDFTADTADGWCEIGVWDAATAAELRDAGLTPDEAKRAAQSLVEDKARQIRYTDGDPIYSACNGDTPVQEIIDAAKRA
jgi:hypothetical protein